MENRELKPCPFCDGEAEIFAYDAYDGYQGNNTVYLVRCTKCWVELTRGKKDTAIEAWNRRANDGKET